MGATDTMELFFEQLNGGSREGAVALMDERIEMRIHVGENARTLRGLDQVSGWFLRADAGLKMIPGAVQDMGNTYQADLLVVRPGAESQHLDAAFAQKRGEHPQRFGDFPALIFADQGNGLKCGVHQTD